MSSTETLRAIATASGYSTSGVASATYTITPPPAATPTSAPAAGTYTAVQSVTIADTTPGAAIYYTANGTAPLQEPLSIPVPPGLVQPNNRGHRDCDWIAPSGVASAIYTINLRHPPSPSPGPPSRSRGVATIGNTSTITLTPAGGFTGAVTLTAAIMARPSRAIDPPTLSFGSTNPANVTGTAPVTATLTISTTAATAARASRPTRPNVPWLPTGGTILACILIWGSPRKWRSLLGMALLWRLCHR